MNTQNKNSDDKETKADNTDWKMKFSDLMSTAQTELKKTTKIGMKMISATQSNSQLHEAYETMGKWLYEQVANGSIKVDDVKIEGLISKVKELEKELENFESEVQHIKKGD